MIHKALWEKLESLDPAEVCSRTGACKSSNGFVLPVLNTRFIVDPAAEVFTPAPGEQQRKPNFLLELSGVQYLINARMAPLGEELVSAEQFDGGGIYFRGPHAVPTQQLVERFGKCTSEFGLVAHSLGGNRVSFGDEAWTLDLFPRLPVTVVLWGRDEEFPARASVLFDPTAGQQMPLDALLAGTNFLVKELAAKSIDT